MSSLGVLFAEELKATMRGRFAWAGAAAILLAIGGLATVGTQDTWLDGYGIIAYGLAPLAFIPIAAVMIASPRTNRFVESVFTAPVRRGQWLAAKFLVLATLAAAYYLALLPMMLVYVAQIGLPPLLRDFLWWTPGLLLLSISTGTLIGVLFIGRSLAAPAGASMGVLLAYAGLIPLQELMVAQGNGATLTGHVTLASPPVLLKNAIGFTILAANIPATTAMTWISLIAFVVGVLVLAAYVFLRAQGVETWEATRPQRWIIGLALAALVIGPAALADVDYDKPAPKANSAPAIRALFARAGASVAMVREGGAAPALCCSTILNRDDWPLPTDQVARRELLLFLPVTADTPLRDLRIGVTGENGLEAAVTDEPQLERHRYADATGPLSDDGKHIADGWVARVPVALNPTNPWDIGGDRYPLNVIARYEAGDATHNFTARVAVDAEVGPAIWEMGLAAGLLPLLCILAGLVRWRRTQ